jgi:hypothetical protein
MRTHAARAATLAVALLVGAAPMGRAQQTPEVDSVADLAKRIEALEKKLAALDHANDRLEEDRRRAWFGASAHGRCRQAPSLRLIQGRETTASEQRHPFESGPASSFPKLDRKERRS